MKLSPGTVWTPWRGKFRALLGTDGHADAAPPHLLRLPTDPQLLPPRVSLTPPPLPEVDAHPGRARMQNLEYEHIRKRVTIARIVSFRGTSPVNKRFVLSLVGNHNNEGAWLGDYLSIPQHQQLHIKVCGSPYKRSELGITVLDESGSSLKTTRRNRAKLKTDFDDAAVIIVGHVQVGRVSSAYRSERLVAKLTAQDFIEELMEHNGQRFAPKHLTLFVCNSATFGEEMRNYMSSKPESIVCIRDDHGINPYPGNSRATAPLKLYYGFEQDRVICEPKTDSNFTDKHLPIDGMFVDVG